MRGHKAIVRLLLEKGSKDIYGALTSAVMSGHGQIIRLLQKNTIKIETKHTEVGFAVWSAAMRGNKGTVRQLLDKGADINAKDERGMTALHYAVQNRHEETMQLLLERGADIELIASDRRCSAQWPRSDMWLRFARRRVDAANSRSAAVISSSSESCWCSVYISASFQYSTHHSTCKAFIQLKLLSMRSFCSCFHIIFLLPSFYEI